MEIKKKRNGKAFFAGFAVIAASAAVIFFAYKGASVKAPGAAGPGGRRSGAGSAVSVKTMVAKVTTLHGYIATNGEIESQNSVSAFPDMGGKVMSTSIMLGSEVKKGQGLVLLCTFLYSADYDKKIWGSDSMMIFV